MTVPGVEWIRLHLADDAMLLWQAARAASGDPDEPIPFWGVAWGGGLAIARYLHDHPDVAANRRVLDLGSGSGLCAIAARQAGAQAVTAVDIDRYAIAAIELNVRANHLRVGILAMDLLDEEPPDVDLVLAGDCWYEEPTAARATAWLRRAWIAGVTSCWAIRAGVTCGRRGSVSWRSTRCAARPSWRISGGPVPGCTRSRSARDSGASADAAWR